MLCLIKKQAALRLAAPHAANSKLLAGSLGQPHFAHCALDNTIGFFINNCIFNNFNILYCPIYKGPHFRGWNFGFQKRFCEKWLI